jgi:hypothetical protein
MDLWPVILSSSLVSGVVSAAIGGWISLRSKKNEYEHQYFKLILDRRISAYEEVERLIAAIKVAVVDKDRRPYHLMFSREDDRASVYKTLHGTMSNALWLTDDLFELTRRLNMLVYTGTSNGESLIEFGKINYQQISELRTAMERLHFRDMLKLHDIAGFLNAKKPADTYEPLPPSA